MNNLVGRKDVQLKHAIRGLRKYFRTQFKTHSTGLTRRRYINCKPKEIFSGVKHLLQSVLKIQSFDEDLVFYLMGILNVRPITHLT